MTIKFNNTKVGDIIMWSNESGNRPMARTVVAKDETVQTLTLVETISAEDFDQRNYDSRLRYPSQQKTTHK
jgi:hypothetical protein